MSEGLNLVVLIGNVATSELRFTQAGQGVLTVRMATNESWFDSATKERKERVEWHTCVVWGKRAESLGKIIDKGSRINVTGRLQTRSWEDKQGNKRYSTEIVASNVILLGGKTNGTRDRQDDSNHSHDAGGVVNGAGHDENGQPFDDSDIPF